LPCKSTNRAQQGCADQDDRHQNVVSLHERNFTAATDSDRFDACSKMEGAGRTAISLGAGGPVAGDPVMGPRLGQGLDWRIKNFRWRAGA
jgi:hypothetical protein